MRTRSTFGQMRRTVACRTQGTDSKTERASSRSTVKKLPLKRPAIAARTAPGET